MKKINLLICITGIILSGTSCKKFLDQNPLSGATDQTTWKSEGDANASVSACYSLIRSAFNAAITYYTYGDLVSDEFTDVPGGDGAYRDVLNMNWGISIPSANTYDPRLKLRVYTNFYTAISQSNRCLYFIETMPANVFEGGDEAAQQATKNRYMAEAYFTRAFNYFYMARIWGDVPIITTYSPDASAAEQLPRMPQAEVLKQAIADVNKAIESLNWKDDGSPDKVVRADKGAAYALLAHIYAWVGDYDNCIKACDAIINSGSYSFVSPANFMDIYKGQSSESIFEIAQNSSSESINATNAYSFTGVTLIQPYTSLGDPQPRWQLNIGLINYLYDDSNDVRFQKAFTKIQTGSVNAYECIKYANIQNINNNPAYQIAVNNIIVFRLADIMLLKAEALATKSDNAGAMQLLNAVRAARNAAAIPAGASGNDLYYTISDESGRELFLEGHRTFDLIRLERLTGEQQFPFMTQGEFLQGKYYWPIDPTLFLTNSKLTQTPYWVGKIR